jgi:ribonuclease P protein component
LTLPASPPNEVPTQAVLAGSLIHYRCQGMTDEAHFSAEQPGSRPASRLSLTDGDTRRSGSDSRPSCPRSEDAVRLIPIAKRRDFLAANIAKRVAMPGFVLLVRDRADDVATKRLGVTVTKKIGGAVVRNRMKRRFRALAREVIAPQGLVGADHILIGRAGGVERPYAQLKDELMRAIKKAIK